MRQTYIFALNNHVSVLLIRPELAVAQQLGVRPAYHVSDLFQIAGSRATAYRIFDELLRLGFAERAQRGYFTVRACVFQPYHLWPYLLPSLAVLKLARYFGRAYNESDVNYARRLLRGMVTLDYRAYELTQLQTPRTLFMYVDNVDREASRLKDEGFSEGRRGRVAILPYEGDFENEIQRVYLDCLAFGGRSILDAIAIELLYGDKLQVKGVFPAELVLKAREELPRR